MTKKRPERKPELRACGHEDEYERLSIVELPGGGKMIAPVCRRCDQDYRQGHPIPCVGCGGFDPRPGWRGEFNSPTGYYGGGGFAGHHFPWCPVCFEPLPSTCSDCHPKQHQEHVCGVPLRLADDAPELLAWRYIMECLEHPSFGIELRHLLGDRHFPSGYSDVPDFAAMYGNARSLWPSVEEAWAAIEPIVAVRWAARQEFIARSRAEDEERRAKEQRRTAPRPEQLGFDLGTGASAFTKALGRTA